MNPHFPPVVPTMTSASTGVTTGVTPAYATSTSAYATTTPQYAEFDVSKPKPGGEDALPAMPVWEESGKKKIMVEEEEVEMDQLKKPEGSGQNGALAPGMAAAGAIPNAVSPVGSPGLNRSPYGPPAGNPNSSGYFPASGIENDPYAQNSQGYSQGAGGYGQAMNQPSGQGYGMAGAGMAGAAMAGAGRRSPYTDAGYGQQQQTGGRGYGTPQQDSYNNSNNYSSTGQQQGYDNYSGATAQSTNQGYGMSPARRSPPNELPADNGYAGAYGQEPVRRSPAPQYGQGGARQSPAPQANYGGGYNNTGYDNRGQYSTDSQRPLQPVGGPYRQYSRDAVSPAPAAVPVSGDAGFDFGTSAYSRPQQGYRQPSPAGQGYSGQGQQYGRASPGPQQQQNTGGYQGYKPYGGGQQGGW